MCSSRRPSAPQSRGGGETDPPALHGRGQAAHPGRGRSREGDAGGDRGVAPARGPVLPRIWWTGGESAAGIRAGPDAEPRGPKAARNPLGEENAQSRRENQRLTEHLRKAGLVIDVQKKAGGAAGAADSGRGTPWMAAVRSLAAVVGVEAACAALNVPRSALLSRPAAPRRARHPAPPRPARWRRPSGTPCWPACTRTASRVARPAAVYATLLDEGHYHCSMPAPCIGSWPQRGKCATGARSAPIRRTRNPNCWPLDPISEPGAGTSPELKGPAKWTYFYLYVLLDVFSRYVVGWLVAPRESAELAKRLIDDTCTKQAIAPGQLHRPTPTAGRR